MDSAPVTAKAQSLSATRVSATATEAIPALRFRRWWAGVMGRLATVAADLAMRGASCNAPRCPTPQTAAFAISRAQSRSAKSGACGSSRRRVRNHAT